MSNDTQNLDHDTRNLEHDPKIHDTKNNDHDPQIHDTKILEQEPATRKSIKEHINGIRNPIVRDYVYQLTDTVTLDIEARSFCDAMEQAFIWKENMLNPWTWRNFANDGDSDRVEAAMKIKWMMMVEGKRLSFRGREIRFQKWVKIDGNWINGTNLFRGFHEEKGKTRLYRAWGHSMPRPQRPGHIVEVT